MAEDELPPLDDDFNLPEQRPGLVHSDLSLARRKRESTRRAEALALLMEGATYQEIADQLQIKKMEAFRIVQRALRKMPASGIETLRKVENARLDRLQQAVWKEAIAGDHKAITSVLAISARRAKLNGLDAPLQIEMSAHVKVEMQQALAELQEIVLGEVIVDEEEFHADPAAAADPADWPEAERG